jgi:AbrB family looped-hinge helix DNA binding protein
MRITSKGQVTIPQALREKHGLHPNTEIDFIDGADGVRITPAKRLSKAQLDRGIELANGMIARLQALEIDNDLSSDDVMRMTRGDEWPDLH